MNVMNCLLIGRVLKEMENFSDVIDIKTSFGHFTHIYFAEHDRGQCVSSAIVTL